MKIHDLLGIPEDSTPEEIADAFRKACLKQHPDMGGSLEGMKELNQAYDEWQKKVDPDNSRLAVYIKTVTREVMGQRTISSYSSFGDQIKSKIQRQIFELETKHQNVLQIIKMFEEQIPIIKKKSKSEIGKAYMLSQIQDMITEATCMRNHVSSELKFYKEAMILADFESDEPFSNRNKPFKIPSYFDTE